MTDDNPIPEKYRRQALYAAMYHHDGIASAGGAERDGEPVTVEIRPPNHPQAPDGDPDDTREYIKRMAGALGYSFASRGPYQVRLCPDAQHALAGLQGASA